jgi:hypothetical protein
MWKKIARSSFESPCNDSGAAGAGGEGGAPAPARTGPDKTISARTANHAKGFMGGKSLMRDGLTRIER